jgi:hypothetical protein
MKASVTCSCNADKRDEPTGNIAADARHEQAGKGREGCAESSRRAGDGAGLAKNALCRRE